jgi:regulator of protease activity HflC (stomatin/prohibitin superfamily)
MDAMLVIVIVATLFVIIFVASGLKIIPQAETRIIERLGKYNRTLESGVNIIIPVFDKPRSIFWRYRVTDVSGDDIVTQRMTKKIDLREQVFDFPRQNVITKDNVTIEIDAMLYFQITDPVKSTYEIANLPNAIEKLTQTTLRNVLGELDLDECLVSRDIINTKLRAILDEATDKWGVKVNRVELQDITPPPEIQKAMEQQMRAERDRRASILEAE